MSWASIGSTDWVTNSNAKNAVDTGVFTLKSGQSVPDNSNFITKGEAVTKLNINSIGGNSTDWATKGQFVSSVTYYGIGGCYNAIGGDDEGACPVVGTDTYYNTTGSNGWDIDDIVYYFDGVNYIPLGSLTGDSGAVSYTRAGTRVFVYTDPDGRVSGMGNCNVLDNAEIYMMNARLEGPICIIDMESSRVVTTDVDIDFIVKGLWSGATAPTSMYYYTSSYYSQYGNEVFNIYEYGGFVENEPVQIIYTAWTPLQDGTYRYNVSVV